MCSDCVAARYVATPVFFKCKQFKTSGLISSHSLIQIAISEDNTTNIDKRRGSLTS